MNNYVCRIASIDDVIKKYDNEIENTKDKSSLELDKKSMIERIDSGRVISYYGLLDDKIICEANAVILPPTNDNSNILFENNSAYLYNFKTTYEYQGKGYFSKLFKFLIEDLKKRGYEKVTLGIEDGEIKNKEIYSHYGFNELLKKENYEYPNGKVVEVEYYRKSLK